MCRIKRTFHPIGQGAFYSEKINCGKTKYNIVYDCGDWRNTKLADKIVKQSFKEEDEIDILFISHFDYDHISKIPTLKKHVTKIKNVVIPLLHDQEKKLLKNINRILNFDILTLIDKPEDYFDDDTNIIKVLSTEDRYNENEGQVEYLLEELSNVKAIKSGSRILLNQLVPHCNWIYVPYNYKYSTRNQKLIDLLKKQGFNVNKLMNDPKCTLEKIVEDTELSEANGGKKFKKAYKQVNGNINENSMFLYSGPNIDCCFHKDSFIGNLQGHLYKHIYYHRHLPACIYTGDGNLNIVKIDKIYKKYWDLVGTIQIPHHGDIKSYDGKLFEDKYFLCPISFGTNNSYGHPSSDIVGDIFSKGNIPIFITEKTDSTFVEIIYC